MATFEAPLNALYRDHIEMLHRRATAALEAHGYDGVVVHSGRLQLKSPFDDAEWPYRPVPMFTYWTPLAWPDSAVVVTGAGAKLWALQPSGFWERPAEPDWGLMQGALDVEVTGSVEAIKAGLPAGKLAFIGHEPEAAADLGLAPEHVNPSALVVGLEDGRVEKTPYEVEVMARATTAGVRGHLAAARAFEQGERSELQIHLAYLQASGQDDADTPYKGIVALGEAAATLHHNVYGERPGAGSLLIDAGARYNGYPCDITRTHAAGGPAGERAAFQALIEALDGLQQAVIGDIRVGMSYEDLHDGCHRRLGQLMVEQGLVTCSAEVAVDSGITRAFFPHGLGHSIGVQVHDVSCRKRPPRSENAFLRHTAEITVGQVFTIEPGLYFIEPLLSALRGQEAGRHVDWAAVDRLTPFGGIRIEDNVYVRPAGGLRNLTREAFAAAA